MPKAKPSKTQSKKTAVISQPLKSDNKPVAEDAAGQPRSSLIGILLLAIVIGGLTFSAAYGGGKNIETAAEPIPEVTAAVHSEISTAQPTDSAPSDSDDDGDFTLNASAGPRPAATNAQATTSVASAGSSASQSPPPQPAAAPAPAPATNNPAPDSDPVTEKPSEPDHPGLGLNLDRIIGHLPVEALLRIKL